MSQSLLEYFLISQLFAFLLIFCRVGAALMSMPGFGEVYVSPRIRLLFALVFSILLTPMILGKMPAMPGNVLALFIMMLGEIIIGVFIGTLARTILISVHVAGNIIASQSSLAVAAMFDPSSGAQSAVISNMLSLAALTLFFGLNLHHLVLAAIVQSYDMFGPAAFPRVADMNILNARLMADSFNVGVMMAAPHIVFSLLFYLAGGLMTRLMPNFQVFFIAMPLQILVAVFLFMAILPMVMDAFVNFMQDQLMNFVRAG